MYGYTDSENINLVMTQMAEELGSTTAAMGVVSSALFWCYAFGFVKDTFGWPAVFITIGCLYVLLLVLTLLARKMKMKRL